MSDKNNIRLLLVDDSADDRELILMNLRKGGYEPDYLCVDTEREFTDALENRKWDLILCDYSMPGFDGLSALEILNRYDRDIPFILISGAIGEELAVKAMKAGAHDYLMKDNLKRLVPAIERELNEVEMRKKHRLAEQERDRLLTVIHHSLNEIYIFDANTLRFRYLNEAAIDNLAYSEDEIRMMTPLDIKPEFNSYDKFNDLIEPLRNGERHKILIQTKHLRSDGTTYPIEIHLQLIKQGKDRFFTAIGFDQTDREKDAKQIKKQKQIAKEMALNSKYKSEFLANMSHELRTPLNSILLLSELLLKNSGRNLTTEQAEYISVIHQSGGNLLELINEVLDLSKIEAGEMEITLEDSALDNILQNIKSTFSPIALEKGVGFEMKNEISAPLRLTTDQQRIEQVLRNLLSNAFKFTESGTVSVEIFNSSKFGVSGKSKMIGIRVSDTGIGIPEEKQQLIFESFRQVDGSIQRKFGGTGLGLAICKQIAELLGGSISVESSEGEGSRFTLLLPIDSTPYIKPPKIGRVKKTSHNITGHKFPSAAQPQKANPPAAGSPELLLVTDNSDVKDHIMQEASRQSLNVQLLTGSEDLLGQISRIDPPLLFIDPFVGGYSCWSLVRRARQEAALKNTSIWLVTPENSEIPLLYTDEIEGILSLPFKNGEFSKISSSRYQSNQESGKTVLLIDDNKMHNEALREFALEYVDRCLTVETAREAFQLLEKEQVDCIVLDLTLPDASGADVLKTLSESENHADIPVIIYSGRSLSEAEKQNLMTHASDVILKNVGSHSKLMKKIRNLTTHTNSIQPEQFIKTDLKGKTVLIADDDERSFFSLSALLKSKKINVLYAANGREALSILKDHPEIDLILMDIMMPEMDGFEALKQIRNKPEWRKLPIISVTAKAMKGDREECLTHGATDYISKPVDPTKLTTLLTTWI